MADKVDVEIGRWQDAIYELCKTTARNAGLPEHTIDGAGCDSSDPLDFSLTEIGQAITIWQDRAETAEAQLAAALRDKERLLERYGLHDNGCAGCYNPRPTGSKCTCGLDAAMSSSQPPAPTCARCDGPLLFRRDCHICNVPLCDHTCEEWHLEKVHGQS